MEFVRQNMLPDRFRDSTGIIVSIIIENNAKNAISGFLLF